MVVLVPSGGPDWLLLTTETTRWDMAGQRGDMADRDEMETERGQRGGMALVYRVDGSMVLDKLTLTHCTFRFVNMGS